VQVANVVSAFAENMAGSYVLRVSAVNCATHAELCTQKEVKDSSEIRVCLSLQAERQKVKQEPE
jgi:hypothetical protein